LLSLRLAARLKARQSRSALHARKLRFSVATLTAALTLSLALALGARADLPPLVPRAVFWSNPSRVGPEISPDGKRLAYRARSKAGVMNLWIRPLPSGADEQITADRVGNIGGVSWAADSRHLLYIKDADGDENWHLFSVDLETRQVRDLTPFVGVRAENVTTDGRHPNDVLVGMNLRDRRFSDMYRVNLLSGAVTLAAQNPGDVTEWLADSALVIRACVALDSLTANTVIRIRSSATAPWRTLQVWPFLEAGNDRDQRLIEFSRDGRTLLTLSTLGSNTSRFVSIDAATGHARDSLAADPRADVMCDFDFAGAFSPARVLLHPRTGAVQAYAVDPGLPEWKVLDPSLRRDFDALLKLHRGDLQIRSRDAADEKWVVALCPEDGPQTYYLWDRATQHAESLFVNVPELSNLKLAQQKFMTIRARDGLEVPCYLTLPVGVAPKKLPLIVFPHGGPWARDVWGFDPSVQFLANRGYAVLQVEYRGSTGFGSAYINASIGQEGTGGMQNDISDAVRWCVREGIADSTRLGIFGYSGGGYATLCGLAFTPDLYACGVDVVGPSNLQTLLRSFPPYWAPRLRRWLLRFGDVLHDDALNERVSPLFHVDKMRAPLMIGHGVNDPRVKIAESERIVAALRARGQQVTFVVYPDEGHGFNRPENNMDFSGRMEEFLAKHLHGRTEPWKKIEGSSGELR
jgi:dipeptidyl aminopeptidase/acylaminoacyl peptidase